MRGGLLCYPLRCGEDRPRGPSSTDVSRSVTGEEELWVSACLRAVRKSRPEASSGVRQVAHVKCDTPEAAGSETTGLLPILRMDQGDVHSDLQTLPRSFLETEGIDSEKLRESFTVRLHLFLQIDLNMNLTSNKFNSFL